MTTAGGQSPPPPPPSPPHPPPVQPRCILRGHKAQVHAAAFFRDNERLATGDADGAVLVWDLAIMRPRAVWKAHGDVMLGVCGWGRDRLVTHGRDNRLVVWQLSDTDEASLETTLPLDSPVSQRPKPWLLHVLEISTMNFCTFSLYEPPLGSVVGGHAEALIAVPNTLSSEAVDIFHLPSQRREHTIKLGQGEGMIMALKLFRIDGYLTVAIGYENGVALVVRRDSPSTDPAGSPWSVRYRARAHTQPVLSLAVAPSRDFFLTSSADSLLVKHPIPGSVASGSEAAAAGASETPEEAVDVSVDEKSASTTSTTPTSEVPSPHLEKKPHKPVSLLSAALAREAATATAQPTASGDQQQNGSHPPSAEPNIATEPIKVRNTKHAGQQGLQIRSDGRIFATAGWDSRVRVYSCKTMKELAVLKWHRVGCYALAFSIIVEPNSPGEGEPSAPTGMVPRAGDVSVKDARISHARSAHWLAAGAKDGKVSLWEIY